MIPVISAVGIQVLEDAICPDDLSYEKGEPEAPLVHSFARPGRVGQATAAPRGARLILPAFKQPVHTLTLMIFPSGPKIRAT